MTRKYHKIKGIDLKTCTAEAVVAYNICFSYRDLINLAEFKTAPAFIQAETEKKIIDLFLSTHTQENLKGVNLDLVICCLRSGFKEYMFSDYSIICDYSEIGKIFKSRYLN